MANRNKIPLPWHGRPLLRSTFLAVRQIGSDGVIVVHIVVIDIVAAIGVERIVVIVVVRRAQPGISLRIIGALTILSL